MLAYFVKYLNIQFLGCKDVGDREQSLTPDTLIERITSYLKLLWTINTFRLVTAVSDYYCRLCEEIEEEVETIDIGCSVGGRYKLEHFSQT